MPFRRCMQHATKHAALPGPPGSKQHKASRQHAALHLNSCTSGHPCGVPATSPRFESLPAASPHLLRDGCHCFHARLCRIRVAPQHISHLQNRADKASSSFQSAAGAVNLGKPGQGNLGWAPPDANQHRLPTLGSLDGEEPSTPACWQPRLPPATCFRLSSISVCTRLPG